MRRGVKYLIYFLVVLVPLAIYADHEAPVARTNINEKTIFFESNVENSAGLKEMIKNDQNTYSVESNETNGLGGIVDINHGNFLSEVENLKSLNSSDLESKGRGCMVSTEGNEIMTSYPNTNDPLLQREKEDLDEIATKTSNALDGFMSKLKDVGVDCKEEGVNRMEDPVFVIGEQKTILDSNYDQIFCEELKNTYQCKKHLTVKCHEKNSKGFGSTTFKMNSNISNVPFHYNVDSGALKVGGDENQGQLGGLGIKYSYDIDFDIANVRLVYEFTLRTVGYDDLIRISVNGRQVFIGPHAGDRLELTSEGVFNQGQWSYKVRINGAGAMVPAETSLWKKVHPNIDLRGYLREGKNTINITLIVAGTGGVHVAFVARCLACDYLLEEWRETCVHQK